MRSCIPLISSYRSWRIVVLAFAALSSLTPCAHADEAQALVNKAWDRYRAVKGEREESDILVVRKPQSASFSRNDAETLLHGSSADVVHKRAVRHVVYTPDHADKIHLLFSLPAEDAGLGFLVLRAAEGQDDMFLFMPGYRDVRRIPVSSKQSLAGTDLLYEDVRELAGERTERYTYETLSPDQVDGRSADVVSAKPNAAAASAYGSRKIWIDQEWVFPVKVEFYDYAGALWKVLRNSEIHEVAPGVHRADLTEMRDVQRNQATVVLVTKRSVAADIPGQVFSRDYLVHPGAD